MIVVKLSRRNLQTLLNKLDRNKANPGSSECAIFKRRDGVYLVKAIEDEDYYKPDDVPPGPMHPLDTPR